MLSRSGQRKPRHQETNPTFMPPQSPARLGGATRPEFMPEAQAAYSDNFYRSNLPGMSQSAATVLGLLYRDGRPASVLDVGCGRGAWLAAAEALGTRRLRGLDGPWVRPEQLLSPGIEFSAVDFEGPLPALDERYDLCLSLEVAEHLPAARATEFVDYLCAASDRVLFSAAIPLQGGTHHINEQPQSYWAALFAARGYRVLDVIRPALWEQEQVEPWYRQNTLLYVKQGAARDGWSLPATSDGLPLDLVHPQLYQEVVGDYRQRLEYPTLGFCLACFRRYAICRISKLLQRLGLVRRGGSMRHRR